MIFSSKKRDSAESKAQKSRYWMHNAYINVDNKKMFKSEGTSSRDM